MKRFLILVSWLLICVASLSARSLVYDQIEVEMTLNRDTSINVVETQQVTMSGKWNGLYRDYNTAGADALTTFSVSENGVPYDYGSVAKKGSYAIEPQDDGVIKVRWRSVDKDALALNNRKTSFEVGYRITGAIGQFRKRDVLHWKPIFQDREYPVRKATVVLKLPEAADMAEVTFYSEVSDAKWAFNDDHTELHFTATNVPSDDAFEIKVALPKGILDPYESTANRYRFHIKPFFVPLGLVLLGCVLSILWFLFGKDPNLHRGPFIELELKDLPPGIMGLMMDERFDNADLTATILDLARRGYLELTEQERHDLLSSSLEIKMKLLKVPDAEELREFEWLLVQGLFGPTLRKGEVTSTTLLKDRFYKHLPKIKKAAWGEVIQAGWFDRDPRFMRKLFAGAGLALGACGVLIAGTQREELGFIVLWGSIFGGVPGFILLQSVRTQGIKAVLKGFFLVPFVLIGLGVMGGFFFHAYLTGGFRVDCGLLLFFWG